MLVAAVRRAHRQPQVETGRVVRVVVVDPQASLKEMQLRVLQIQAVVAVVVDILEMTQPLVEKELLLSNGDSNNGLLC